MQAFFQNKVNTNIVRKIDYTVTANIVILHYYIVEVINCWNDRVMLELL